MTQSIGPPSLAQGTRIAVGFSTSISRFIPAYAGNSALLNAVPDGTSVHPRLRGELFPDGLINDPLIGSSPLTRGTPVRFKPSFSLIRFIPAYAGNSRETVSRSKSKSVHPRLRGELNLRSDNVSEAGGSSPLTRGTQY